VNNKAIVLACVVAGVVYAAYAFNNWSSGTFEAATVVTLPQRPAESAVTPAATIQPQKATATPSDRASLARELQRELKRVGCYDGEVNGIWTTTTRVAMKTFTDRVNASLPIDAPDYVLLSLVQGQQDKVCGASCPAGQVAGEGGRCLPQGVIGQTARAEPADRIVEPADSKISVPPTSSTSGAMTPALATAAVGGLAAGSLAAKRDAVATPERARPAAVPAPGGDVAAAEERPRRSSARQGGPVPPDGIHEQRQRRPVKRSTHARPPKFVRTLMRDVQRMFGFR
jgi:hypothetical protein